MLFNKKKVSNFLRKKQFSIQQYRAFEEYCGVYKRNKIKSPPHDKSGMDPDIKHEYEKNK